MGCGSHTHKESDAQSMQRREQSLDNYKPLNVACPLAQPVALIGLGYFAWIPRDVLTFGEERGDLSHTPQLFSQTSIYLVKQWPHKPEYMSGTWDEAMDQPPKTRKRRMFFYPQFLSWTLRCVASIRGGEGKAASYYICLMRMKA